MFCSSCGSKNVEGVNFCGNCGKPLKRKSRVGWMLFAIFACVCILGGVGYGFYQIYIEKAPETATLAEKEKKEEPVQQVVRVIEREGAMGSEDKPIEKERTELIQETLPRVFTIMTDDGLGSGFLYAKGGFIVTNAHVVLGSTDVIVKNSVGREAPGKVIGISGKYDIALIQSDVYKDLNPLETEPNETKVGTEVIALGSPKGLENTASIGYLTGLDRDFEEDFIYEKVYQVDVQIEQGSSGGPLIDAKTGKVIGINSLLLNKNRRFGFSIPLHSMTHLLDDWMHNPMTDQQVAAVFGGGYDYGASQYYSEDSYAYDGGEDEFEDYEGDAYFYDEWLQDFILEFRRVYETALYQEDFSLIAPFLQVDSSAYQEFEDYFEEISGEGMVFEFLDNAVTGIEIYDDHALVLTSETLNFRNQAGQEKYYEKEKEYVIVISADSGYKIQDVKNR